MALAHALNKGMRAVLARDPKTLLMGEDIGKLGGVFRVTDGLQEEFGPQRVRDTPLAESGIVGTALGLAVAGYRSIVEIQFDGFVFPAYDQITSQLAKYRKRSGGRQDVPVVVRIPYGGNIGAIEHHSESPEALFLHTAGLRVITPANAQDAHDMIQWANACPDPVIFMEPKGRYWAKSPVDTREPDLSEAGIARGLNHARVVREGGDITLIGYGPMVHVLLDAAEVLAAEGTSAEVVDLRTLSPLDTETIVASVRKTGRAVVAHEAPEFAGVGAEVCAQIAEHCFYELQAPPVRAGGWHLPYPAAALESHYVPGLDRVIDAADAALSH